MADMVWRPRFGDLEAEREVVLEEIAMYEDDPQDQVFDVLGEAVFGEHPLGRPVIGRAEVDRAPSMREDLRAFHAERYRPGSIVVAAAGSVDHERSCELVHALAARDRERRAGAAARRELGAPRRSRARVRVPARRTPSSTTSASAAPGIARDDERRFALRVLDAILGGTSSSRLFQEVREQPRPRLLGLLVLEPVRRHRRRSASTSARARTTSTRRWR